MGSTFYKKTSHCECGCDYGSCDKTNIFVLKYNRTCDFGTIFFKRHSEEEKSKFEKLGTFSDNDLSTLSEILNSKDTIETVLAEEYKEIDNL